VNRVVSVSWVVAAILLLGSLVLGAWWSEDDVRVGLGSIEVCHPGGIACRTDPYRLDFIEDPRQAALAAFVWAGRVTFAASIAVIVACLVALWKPRLGAWLVISLAIVTLGAACVFVMSNKNSIPMSYGLSFYLTFGALLLALLGSGIRLLARSSR
jgi:hypothetical protein